MRKYLQSYDTYTVYGKTWLTLLRLKTPKRVHWKTMKTQICTHELVTFLRKNGRVFVNILGLELAIDPLPPGGICALFFSETTLYKTQNKRC